MPARHCTAPAVVPLPLAGLEAAPSPWPVYAEPDDSSLLEAVAGGAPAALERLYERHAGAAYGLACYILGDRGLAEDVVQEAFLAVWRQAGQFDPQRGSVRTWITAIVRHRAIDALRRQRHHADDEPATLAAGMGDVRVDVEGAAALSLESARLRAAMLTLPAEQRHALELAYFSGLTHQEIAAQLGLPLGTVKGRLRLALRKLHLLLSGEHAAAYAC